ncbi:flavin reductase family protein [Nocardia salmonicida]|uniref:Flavin reductase family protein n=1 Tax=Nocardia salmonicida TaxID=53431 RepID=A0ABZ1N332_9NOCA
MIIPNSAEPNALRAVYGTFPSGVTAVCALRDGSPVGFAVSSFASVSLEPALVSVCVQRTSTTWPQLADRPRLGLSVLGSDQDVACRRLASKSGDRFADTTYTVTDGGALLLHGAAAWLECTVYQTIRAGDHDVILLRVEAMQDHPETTPLVFHASSFRTLACGVP